MTDFRVVLPAARESAAERELDWEGNSKRWRLSEKEEGEVRWIQDLEPSPTDLAFLASFFRFDRVLDASVLARLSPGELAVLHAAEHSPKQVLVSLCTDCGLHWIVFRLEEDSWRRYGRSCNYSWSRGNVVEPSADKLLAALLTSEGF